jgi:hypothetical protein
MPSAVPLDAAYWREWFEAWRTRIDDPTLARPAPGARSPIRASDVLEDWISIEWPAMEAHYVMPAWWLAMPLEERRRMRAPKPEIEYRRAPSAESMKAGYSLDTTGPFVKLEDGSIFRDQRAARRRLARVMKRFPEVARVVGWLPRRSSQGRTIKGRTAERVLEALVCRSLVGLGRSQLAASTEVIRWSGFARDPRKHADVNREIWREARLPPVAT